MPNEPEESQEIVRSKIVKAIKLEIEKLGQGPSSEIGSFVKDVYTREGHERGTAHEKGSLVDGLERIRTILDSEVLKEITAGVVKQK